MPDSPDDEQPPTISVRPYGPTDRARCAEIYVAARRVAFHWVPPDRFSSDDFVRDTADEDIHVAQGRAADGTADLLGFVSVFLPGRFVHHLYVDPDHRRAGIGRLLIRHAIGLRPPPWRLKCVAANTAALSFYRSEGWVEEGRGTDDLGLHLALRRD